MARYYAALLGMLAFFVYQARSLSHGSDFAANVLSGIAAAAVFALVGGAIGGLAEWILGDTMRQELLLRMNEKKEK